MITLREVQPKDKDDRAIFEMLQTIPDGENGFRNRAYGIAFESFPEYIEKLLRDKNEQHVEKGDVPQSVYWLFDGDGPVGFSKIRHTLNDKLRVRGGHIGYGISNKKRIKGYGSVMLQKSLEIAKQLGIGRILLSCDSDNIGSKKIIERNNGVLEKELDGYCLYWIDNR